LRCLGVFNCRFHKNDRKRRTVTRMFCDTRKKIKKRK
jgi:hypothetical protein